MRISTSARRNGREWRSLQSALARTMVGEDDFADEAATLKGPLWLAFGLRLAFRKSERPCQLRHKSPKEAWLVLAGYIADGQVRARATPVDRYARGPGGPDEWEQLPSTLPAEAADHLVLWEDTNDEIWLAPRNQAFVGGRGRFWKDITINWHDLLKALSDSGAPRTGGRPPDYDWSMIEAKAYAHFDENGGGRTLGHGLQADIEKFIMELAQERHGRQPAESTARERAANVIERLKQRAEK